MDRAEGLSGPGENEAYRAPFNELRTQYTCPHCGNRFPVGLKVFGLDVQIDEDETVRLLLDHVREAPEAHQALFKSN